MSTLEGEDVRTAKAATAKKATRKRAAPRADAGAAITTATGKGTATPEKAAASKKPAAKTASSGKRAAAARKSVPVTPEERWKLIASAAYFKAQARGFAPGGEEADWLEAEREIDGMLS